MTVIAAISDGKRVSMGGDSALSTDSHLFLTADPKVFERDGITYTANPTTGTDGGAIKFGMSLIGSTTTGPGVWEFCFCDGAKSPTLSGTGQGIVLNLNSTTVSGGSFIVAAEWYEF